MKRRALGISAGAFLALGLSRALMPREKISALMPPILLDSQVPEKFANWAIDKSIIPVLPNEEVQAKLDVLYTQVIARTYVNTLGEQVMLSIAYGADQGSDATAAHRPEFCYVAQGFSINNLGESIVDLNGRSLRVKQLFGRLGSRNEPITYWVTLNDTAVLPGLRRKLEQIRVGLHGYVPDGMLVRASTIGADVKVGLALQLQFLASLERALSPSLRSRYFGSGVV